MDDLEEELKKNLPINYLVVTIFKPKDNSKFSQLLDNFIDPDLQNINRDQLLKLIAELPILKSLSLDSSLINDNLDFKLPPDFNKNSIKYNYFGEQNDGIAIAELDGLFYMDTNLDNKFSGTVTLERIDQNGNLLKDQKDILVYEDGRVISYSPAGEGKSRFGQSFEYLSINEEQKLVHLKTTKVEKNIKQDNDIIEDTQLYINDHKNRFITLENDNQFIKGTDIIDHKINNVEHEDFKQVEYNIKQGSKRYIANKIMLKPMDANDETTLGSTKSITKVQNNSKYNQNKIMAKFSKEDIDKIKEAGNLLGNSLLADDDSLTKIPSSTPFRVDKNIPSLD